MNNKTTYWEPENILELTEREKKSVRKQYKQISDHVLNGNEDCTDEIENRHRVLDFVIRRCNRAMEMNLCMDRYLSALEKSESDEDIKTLKNKEDIKYQELKKIYKTQNDLQVVIDKFFLMKWSISKDRAIELYEMYMTISLYLEKQNDE